jgi:hypothetical protein
MPRHRGHHRTGEPGGRGYSLTCTSGLPIFNEFTPSADCIKSMEIRGKQLTLVTRRVRGQHAGPRIRPAGR